MIHLIVVRLIVDCVSNHWPLLLAVVSFALIFLTLRQHKRRIEFTVRFGDRVYTFIPLLESGELCIRGEELRRRARVHNANPDQNDGLWILNYQGAVPVPMRRFNLVFPAWRSTDGHMAYFHWGGQVWSHYWGYGDHQARATDTACLVCRRVQ